MARAWQIPEYAGYRSLELVEVPVETPGPGDVRLRVEAFALNWGDMNLMEDKYSFSFPGFPARVGIEAAGIVDAVGPGVEGLRVGDRVATLPYFYYERGASADTMLIRADYVVKSPANLTPVEAASVWMQYMTAWYPLSEVTPVGPGDFALITAGTSTAGSAALEIGHLRGATMITTTRNEAHADYLRGLGADHVLIDGKDDLAAEITRITGGAGIRMAFDPVGGDTITRYGPALGRDARIYSYGSLSGKAPELPLTDLYQSNAVFQPYSVFNYVGDPVLRPRGTAAITRLLEDGRLKPRVDRVFPMEDYIEAWDYLSGKRDSHGKVVIETGV